MPPPRRRQRKRRPAASRWRRLLVEAFEPRQLLAPVALADSYSTPEDTLLTITAPGILANDTGGATSAVLGSGPLRGLLTLNPNGGFTYVPSANFFGLDSFTYRASDGATTSDLTAVSLNVTAVNDPPVAVNDSYNANEDTVLNGTSVLVNDMDADVGTILSALLVTGPAHGTLTLNPNGSFLYIPSVNFNGLDSFTYRANDGQLSSNLGTVTISVTGCNSPPFAGNDAFSSLEDASLTIAAPGVLANDGDFCGHNNPLTAILVVNPAHGTLLLNSNGSFTYTPNVNYFGPDSFSYRANDGRSSSNLAAVAINVANVSDVPIAINDSYTMLSGTPLTINLPGVIGNDIDVDGDALTASLVTGPAEGTVTLNANGGFTYVSANCFTGTVSFTYRVSDGQSQSNIATVTINVSTHLPSPPVAVNDSYAVNEDSLLNVPAPGVLSNDAAYLPCYPLTASLVVGPSQGTLTLSANGGFAYTPRPDFFGADSYTYRATDGIFLSNIATVTLNVTPVNDPPSFRIELGSGLTVNDDSGPQRIENWATGISAGPGDEQGTMSQPGQTLSFLVTTDKPELFAERPAIDATGALTFTPARNVRGTAPLMVVLKDDGGTAGGGSDTSLPQTLIIAVNKPNPWHNTTILAAPLLGALDVDADGSISPIDAVLVINYLNASLPGAIPANAPIGGPGGLGPGITAFLDTGGAEGGQCDNNIAPLDAVLVINWLNANPPVSLPAASSPLASAEAAGGEFADPYLDFSALVDLLAMDIVSQSKRRRR